MLNLSALQVFVFVSKILFPQKLLFQKVVRSFLLFRWLVCQSDITFTHFWLLDFRQKIFVWIFCDFSCQRFSSKAERRQSEYQWDSENWKLHFCNYFFVFSNSICGWSDYVSNQINIQFLLFWLKCFLINEIDITELSWMFVINVCFFRIVSICSRTNWFFNYFVDFHQFCHVTLLFYLLFSRQVTKKCLTFFAVYVDSNIPTT